MQGLQQNTTVEIISFDTKNPDKFWALIEKMGFLKDRTYYEQSIERQDTGVLQVFLAVTEGQAVGYCLLNWQPKYTYFRLCNIPEIQDLNVLREFRNRGIGRVLIGHCETRALEKKYPQIGIGVGLDNSFGPAQRLYVKQGYIPDGNGICYDRKQVTKGEFRPVDENLCLMMTKTLTKTG